MSRATREPLSIKYGRSRVGAARVRHFLSSNVHAFVESMPFNLIIAFLILLSVFLIFSEYLSSDGSVRREVARMNDIITWVFIIELSLRLLVAPNRRIFFSNYWIDIIAVLPVLRIFRALRLLRLLRVLRLGPSLSVALRRSGCLTPRIERFFGSFGALFVLALMLITCGTLALLTFDEPSAGTGSRLDLFLDRIWMTTFLFISGELVTGIPATAAGKLVAAVISVAGLVVFAIMVGMIAASMTAFVKTRMDAKDLEISDLSGHLLICGWDRMGTTILRELEAVPEVWRKGVVVIAQTRDDLALSSRVANPSRLFHVNNDFTKIDVLEEVGAKKASAAIVLADKGDGLRDQDRDARTVLAALTLEKLNPSIYTVAELLDEQNATHLHLAGVEEIISRGDLTAGLFASNVLSRGVTSVIADLLTHSQGSHITTVSVPEEFYGRDFLTAFSHLKREFDATVLAVRSPQRDGSVLQLINPAHDYRLAKDDLLLVVVDRKSALSTCGR